MLRCSNGLTAQWDVSGLILYATTELGERNATYEVAIYAHTLLMIGDDGGSKGVMLDRTDPEGQLYLLGMGSMAREDAEVLASSFAEWVASGFDLGRDSKADKPELIDVYLTRPPRDGLRTLMRLRRELDLSITPADPREVLTAVPYRLLRAVPYPPYGWRCAHLNIDDPCLGLSLVDQPDQEISLPIPRPTHPEP